MDSSMKTKGPLPIGTRVERAGVEKTGEKGTIVAYELRKRSRAEASRMTAAVNRPWDYRVSWDQYKAQGVDKPSLNAK